MTQDSTLVASMVVGMTLFMAILLSILGVVLARLPGLTRPSIFFSITVSPSYRQTEQAQALVRRYRQRIRHHTIIAIILALVGGLSALWLHVIISILMLSLIPIAWQTGGMIAALLEGRRQVRPHAVRPTGVREALLRPAPAEPAEWARGVLLVLPLLMVAAGAVYLGVRWEDIPERFPIHWDASGEVDGWGTRTPAGVFGPQLLVILSYLPVVLIYLALRRARRVSASGAAGAKESRFRRFWQLAILVMGNAMVAMMTALVVWLPFRGTEQMPLASTLTFLAVTLVGTAALLVLAMRQGQGGQQLTLPHEPAPEEAQGQPIGDGTPDDAWLAGLFYYNRSDPAVMVERRFGVGWDFNWGNRISWTVMLTLLLITGVTIVVALAIGSAISSGESGGESEPAEVSRHSVATHARSWSAQDPRARSGGVAPVANDTGGTPVPPSAQAGRSNPAIC